jgi:aryl-alcohol dehydrogenase-like predicted oxidoreductase
VDGLQVPYNLLKRDIERELLPMAEAMGLSVTAWAPMAAGVLSGSRNRVDPKTLTERDHAAIAAVRKVADELGATPAQVALAWVRGKAVLPLMGVSSVEQLEENLGALELELPGEAVEQLEDAVEFEAGFPSDFIAECEPHPFAFGDAATKVDGR